MPVHHQLAIELLNMRFLPAEWPTPMEGDTLVSDFRTQAVLGRLAGAFVFPDRSTLHCLAAGVGWSVYETTAVSKCLADGDDQGERQPHHAFTAMNLLGGGIRISGPPGGPLVGAGTTLSLRGLDALEVDAPVPLTGQTFILDRSSGSLVARIVGRLHLLPGTAVRIPLIGFEGTVTGGGPIDVPSQGAALTFGIGLEANELPANMTRF